MRHAHRSGAQKQQRETSGTEAALENGEEAGKRQHDERARRQDRGEVDRKRTRQMYKKESKRKKRWMVEIHEENGRYTKKKEEDRRENGHAPNAQPMEKRNQTKRVCAHMYV